MKGDTMEIVRYVDANGGRRPRVGVREPDGVVRRLPVSTLAQLLRFPLQQIRKVLDDATVVESAPIRLLAPVDGYTEVWAAGVTYRRSREARMEESDTADVYGRVYGADRPELFFKAPAWRVRGPGEDIGIREDSDIDVPEPEMAVVLNSHAEIVGVTICDDVSSRSIEGENPLYLPQAKIFAGACALGPVIRPMWEVRDVHDLTISVDVVRHGITAWAATTSTTDLHRRVEELVAYLFRGQEFPFGAVLSTGTGLVPALDFSLDPGDQVTITLEGVGQLTNTVLRGRRGFGRLPDGVEELLARAE